MDGSGRLQTVSRSTNPLYHRLISEFYRKTDVPIILNTSLNENEPIVRTPEEAISCFLRTDMDVLVLGGVVLDRHAANFPSRLGRESQARTTTEFFVSVTAGSSSGNRGLLPAL